MDEQTTTLSVRSVLVRAALGIVAIIGFLLLPMGTWADITALPMHPLIVHGVIVLMPVLAVAVLAAMWRPTLLRRLPLSPWRQRR